MCRFSHKQILSLMLLVSLMVCGQLSAAPVKSLGDLNKVKVPKSFIPLSAQSGNKIFFFRVTDAEGAEPWVTDGTVAGTQILKDIVPGTESSFPIGFAPATVGGQPGAYFVARTPTEGTELWITDGTAAGTKIVKDINPGADDAISGSGGIGLPEIITIPGTSFAMFAADDGTNGKELWSTDGTSGGTFMVLDLEPGAGSSDPQEMTYFPTLGVAGIVVFSASTTAVGREPFYSTGGLGFIQSMGDVNPGAGSSDPKGFSLVTGAGVVFTAENPTVGKELWMSTGTPLATLVSDLNPGAGDSILSNFQQLPSGLTMFTGLDLTGMTFPPPSHIYTTNTTTPGTTIIDSINCLPGGILSFIIPISFNAMHEINGRYVFPCQELSSPFISSVEDSGGEPWVTEGTPGSTKLLKDIFPGAVSSGFLATFRGTNVLIFGANNGVKGIEPWVTDGTEAGTKLLLDLNPGEASSLNSETLIFSTVFGFSNNGSSTASLLPATVGLNQKVVYSDGTAGNTRVLFDDSSTATTDSDPEDFTAFGKKVIFSAIHSKKERELFISGGSKKTTGLLKNIFKAGSSFPGNFTRLNKKSLLFTAADPLKGNELWITDGTKPGTKRVKDIRSGSASSLISLFKAKVKGKLIFAADDGVNGIELWATNGKGPGTKMLKDIAAGSDSSQPDDAVLFNGKVYFTAADVANGRELWVTDGTAAGTNLFLDINPGTSGSSPGDLTVVGDKLYFSAGDLTSGNELWVTDGTPAGTMMLKDIRSGADESSPTNFVVSDGVLFFTARTSTEGRELWRTDGTEAGTILVEDIDPGASSSDITEIVPMSGGRVAFAAYDSVHGAEIWVAGSAAGSAELLKDIYPGLISSYPEDLVFAPSVGMVYFAAESDTAGKELWRTDGTAAGTAMVQDLVSGGVGSLPHNLFVKGKKLYFAAGIDGHGVEPYTMKLP